MIGIIGAMDIEIERINAEMTEKREETVSGALYTIGKIGNTEVVTAICGIGKVFAAICAQTMIIKYGADAIINTGVAGTLTDKIGIMGIVVASGLVQHDMDTTYFGDPKGMISGINVVEFKADEALSQKVCKNIDGDYIRGIIASGDAFIADEEKKKEIAQTFNAVACEMEGGAIAHVCHVNSTPVCVVRSISDGANGDKEMSYEEFREEAAAKSAEIIINTIKNL